MIQPSPVKKPEQELGWEENWVVKLRQYQVDLNYKTSAWDRLESETHLTLLSSLLLEWLEHLKTPIIDKVDTKKILKILIPL